MSGMNVVTTLFGTIKGASLSGKYEGITEFRGVPFAAPPVGKLRWKPPVPPEAWDGVRDCTDWAPVAVQNFTTVEPYITDFFFGGTPKMSEDCLYLNITTGAATAGEKRPVYMWFHGGGLNNGFPYEPEFDASELARKGIVVVTVAQRLNVLGYLALPQLSAEQGGMSGNYGLMDQLQALDWVYENIAAFGGDPDNITAGGQSGGSQKACALAFTAASRGRVKRVILESGLKVLQEYPSLEETEQKGRTFLKGLGIGPDASLDELRAIDPRVFQKRPEGMTMFDTPGNMICDGALVPFPCQKDAIFAYGDGVDILCGTNLGEASLTGRMHDSLPESAEAFFAHFRSLLGDLYDKYGFEDLVQVTDGTAQETARTLASRGLSPVGRVNFSRNVMVNRRFGRTYKDRFPDRRVFSYFFTHLLPCRPEDYGTERDPAVQMAYHSSELFFAFASLREGMPPARPWQPLDFELADTVSSYWANFMKTGDPNGAGLSAWPESGPDFGYMEIGDQPTGHVGLDGPLEEMISAYVEQEYGI